MGSACCVAASDRTITNGSSSENLQRNIRYSPSWSFRWDNRGRVAGEETSGNWTSGGVVGRHDGLDFKSGTTGGTANSSEQGSPLDRSRRVAWQNSPVSEENSGMLTIHPSEPSISRSSPEVKEFLESSDVSDPFPTQSPPSVPAILSVSASPLSSQSHLPPATSTPSRWPRRSPGYHLSRHVSDSRIRGLKSPNLSISEEVPSFLRPGLSNDSTRGSLGGSSDSWSILPSSDLIGTPHRERWSFDSESLAFDREKICRSSGRNSSSFDIRSCGVCTKLLTERSSRGLMAANEIAVVAVLICGHVYHAECLESMTNDINKYDPGCPVCTFGEKQAVKMSEKALRASKRSRNRVVDSDFNSDVFGPDCSKNHQKMTSCSSMKSSSGRPPFLRRHFSFGSKGTRSLSESHSTRKRGFFWAKSSKT